MPRLPLVLLLLALLGPGCGRTATGPVGGDPTKTPQPTASPSASPVPSACEGFEPVAETDFWISLEHDGRTRDALIHVPAMYDATEPVGLLFNFHGYTWDAEFQEEVTNMNASVDARMLVSVHGEGTGNLGIQGWNAGSCCGSAAAANVDDVGFTLALLDELKNRLCVDDARVFSTGISNGGYMSYRLACEHSGVFAAIASVAGLNGAPDCPVPLEGSVPLLHIHGTNDLLVPYSGAQPAVEDWAGRLGCTDTPTVTFDQGEVTCQTWKECTDGNSEATLCTVDGGGHTWPGGPELPGLGHVTHDLDATTAILDFFDAHSMH